MSGTSQSGLWIVRAAYGLALVVAVAVGFALADRHGLFVVAAADITATLVIFGFSRGLRNSSIYDPYWSAAPVAITVYWLAHSDAGIPLARAVLVTILVVAWAVRLTWNFARGWPGLSHEDWRYTQLKERTGRAFWTISFLGIHLFPTLLVYLGCLALWPALAAGHEPIRWLDVLAALVTGGGIAIEAVADQQLRRFRQSAPPAGRILASGLWAYSRHPNYFGELSFWWGLWLFALAADPGSWWMIVGPVSMTLLFTGISIPMMDRRMLQRRPGYAEHKRRVSALVPWFPKGQR